MQEAAEQAWHRIGNQVCHSKGRCVTQKGQVCHSKGRTSERGEETEGSVTLDSSVSVSLLTDTVDLGWGYFPSLISGYMACELLSASANIRAHTQREETQAGCQHAEILGPTEKSVLNWIWRAGLLPGAGDPVTCWLTEWKIKHEGVLLITNLPGRDPSHRICSQEPGQRELGRIWGATVIKNWRPADLKMLAFCQVLPPHLSPGLKVRESIV